MVVSQISADAIPSYTQVPDLEFDRVARFVLALSKSEGRRKAVSNNN